MGNMVTPIIQLISGALGGNLVGAFFKKLSLGTVINSILGILGGGLGGLLMNSLGFGDTGGPSTDIGSAIANILNGGVGGGILVAIIGAIKKAFSK